MPSIPELQAAYLADKARADESLKALRDAMIAENPWQVGDEIELPRGRKRLPLRVTSVTIRESWRTGWEIRGLAYPIKKGGITSQSGVVQIWGTENVRVIKKAVK